MDLSAIEARLAAATPGPWAYQPWSDCALPSGEYSESILFAEGSADGELVRGLLNEDAEFIAHAPEDMRALLDAVQAVKWIHRPRTIQYDPHSEHHTECDNCGIGFRYPCPTLRALGATE